jgi:hypothetical protein
MKIFMTIGNPGAALSCATPVDAVAGQGSGMRWAKESAMSAGIPARLRHLADRSRVGVGVDVDVVPTATDLPTNKQPKIYVPHPPLERSP